MSSSPPTYNDIVEESLDVNNVDTIVIKKTTEDLCVKIATFTEKRI